MDVKIIECPRDAMQGFDRFIPTETKADYINSLLRVGFHSIDFGSFVSPRAIPQMRDTVQVLEKLDASPDTRLLAIVANEQGADTAASFSRVNVLGFPFSVSETFQKRNTNSTIAESVKRVEYIQNLCEKTGKELVVYISMGFGNPYGDEWNVEIVDHWVGRMAGMGISTISLSDTIGIANPDSIAYLFSHLIPAYPAIEFGAHLHTLKNNWEEKVAAAYANGCRRFDGAINGFGGCPMAADELTGNMPTESLLDYFDRMQVPTGIDKEAFAHSMRKASLVFV